MAYDWLTNREETEAFWPDAPFDEDVLAVYLDAAKDACLAYAPALPEDADGIPPAWRLAQALQARNVWNSSQAQPGGGEFDGGGYGINTFPLDWQVQQLLRPRTALGAIV